MTDDIFFCQQRKLRQLFNVPLTRFTPENPYSSGKFTKTQLDMRRKAEILKYSPNKSATQTNNLTKKELFALLAKGNSTVSQSLLDKARIQCAVESQTPMPTSSSDVPGPVTYLYTDETVPLYNYSNYNTRSYPDYVDTNTDPWQFVVKPDTLVYSNGTSNVYYLIIQNNINQPLYYYTITTPIGLSIDGSTPPNFRLANIAVTIVSMSLLIYYGDSLVNTVDVSADQISNFGFILNLENTGSSTSHFSATRFVGNVVFSNIALFTKPTYSYSFVLSATLSVSPSNTLIVSNYVAIIANMTNIVNNSIGCTFNANSPIVSAVNIGASISGV
jgi:hypothetical protein